MKRQKRKNNEYVSLSSVEIDNLSPSKAYDILFKDYSKAIDRKLDDSCIHQILQLTHIVKKRMEFIADKYEQFEEVVIQPPSTIEDVRLEMEKRKKRLEIEKKKRRLEMAKKKKRLEKEKKKIKIK